ncbi:retrotransposon protein, putative, ty1-copia subclass [Tanacetum coccineum]
MYPAFETLVYNSNNQITTSVGNNSVFRSFFKKQKLTGPNFIDWYRQLRLVLSTEDKENYLEHPIPAAPVAQPGQQVPPEALAAHAAWVKGQKEVAVLMLLTMDLDIQHNLVSSCAYDMLPTVEAIGTYHFRAPSGLVYCLNNCPLCSHDSRVSKNNLVYFKAVPRNGIFEIDMSCSNTNDSSMHAITNKRAKINLDSSLLWHCRLGHISKKRIEKLQHDGLLNSIDIESLGKCVSCLSGKMARKPYSHQVERAKDLLGLIHTDVCGPFRIVSRQGASYFVTFTDDFSRYGYVYLLKHKHEVFETFKVFQKEVENQLGKTIKSLRSDRGDTSLNHEEDDQEIDEPQSDINPIRRSTRTRRPTDRLCLYIDAEEHELGDLGEPANYKAALLDPESKKWLDAMNVEMQSMKDNDVWVLVELPPNARTVGSKWLFKKKTDMDGAVYVFKARLVAKGFTQTYGVDYEETFSPVADIRAIRILIAITAYYDYEIWKIDVKTAFLNGHLFEKVYMEQPEGFVDPKYPNHVCKLKRFIYGLNQAYRQWNKRFDDEIKKFGFTQNRDEPCVYLKASGSYIAILKIYLYAVRCTRPDVRSHKNNDKPIFNRIRGRTLTVVKNILKYLRNTKDMFLVYGGNMERELRVSCYTDAGYLTDADDLKSQTGYVFVLNGGVVN